MKLSEAQLNDLLFTERPFGILVEGIWRPSVGVYLPPIDFSSKLNIKCKLNGKTITLGPGFYIDLGGLTDKDIENHIINQNISMLPAKKRVVNATGRNGGYVLAVPAGYVLAADLVPRQR